MIYLKAIVAVDTNGAIGKDGELLFHLAMDLKNFKRITKNHVVLMGRKTFESLPNMKPLPERTNIILTRNLDYKVNGALVIHNDKELDSLFKTLREESIIVIGGGEIYKKFFDRIDYIYLTKVYSKIPDADTFFPELKENEWKCVDSSLINIDQTTGISFKFKEYKRIK